MCENKYLNIPAETPHFSAGKQRRMGDTKKVSILSAIYYMPCFPLLTFIRFFANQSSEMSL
jgi:hypothetical protein